MSTSAPLAPPRTALEDADASTWIERLGRWGPLRLTEGRWAATSLVLFVPAAVIDLAGGPTWLAWTLFAACYVAGGWEPAVSGLRALRERTLDVDLLMIVAAIGAAAIGQVLEGGLLIVIFATSGALEAWATARTEDSVRGLLAVSPDTVTRRVPGGAGREEQVPAAELRVGDIVVVRPGADVGADGTVIEGESDVDQATITGESVPAARRVGDEVFAGTRNGVGSLAVRVSREAGDTVVARIGRLVEEASRTKATTQMFIERLEQRYSVGVVVGTVAVFSIPLLVLGHDLESALLRAMTFMIVASPCALVLATMPPLLAAVSTAGRRGVLVRSARVMEQVGALRAGDVVAFDKTGTLTLGRPELVAVHALGGRSEHAVLRLAAGAEHGSEHPLGRAVVIAAQERDLEVPAAHDFVARPGRGVVATLEGRRVAVGSPTRGPRQTDPGTGADPSTGAAGGPSRATDRDAAVRAPVEALEAAGHTALVVTVDDEPVAVLGFADRLRPGAADAVADIRRRTGARPVLLTGDHPRAAAAVASAVGIEDVRAGLLPEDKVAAVEELRRGGTRVLVVGDGINDAPALAAADVGIAMGGAGADLTLHAAGVVMVRDDLAALPGVLVLAQRARRTMIANLVIAGAAIVVLVTWDLVWYLPLPLGVAGHEGSTVLVALNGLRLLRSRM